MEVWLRLWLLCALRAISTKDFKCLGQLMCMFRKKQQRAAEESGEEAGEEEVDLIQTPCLFLIIPKLQHVEAQHLAGHYFTQVFSDELTKMIKAEESMDLVWTCLVFYNGWTYAELELDSDLESVPDPVLTAHDEVLRYATAIVAVAHYEPVREGPRAATEVFAEKNRKQQSKHGQEFIKTVQGNRFLWEKVEDYWTLMERESGLVEHFLECKALLQSEGATTSGVSLSTLLECTKTMPKWRSAEGLRETACAFFDGEIHKYLQSHIDVMSQKGEQADLALPIAEELEVEATNMNTVARLCKHPDMPAYKEQLSAILQKLSTANSWEKLKDAVARC